MSKAVRVVFVFITALFLLFILAVFYANYQQEQFTKVNMPDWQYPVITPSKKSQLTLNNNAVSLENRQNNLVLVREKPFSNIV